MNASDDIIVIIAKNANGQASAAELQVLEQWLQSDAANRLEHNELVKIWHDSARVLNQPAFNTGAAWQQVAAQMKTGAIQSSTARLVIFRRLAVAAILVATLATGWYLWQDSTSWKTFTADTANQTLTLPDGSTVLLRKGTRIQYPPRFTETERFVKLSGEAFFNVQHRDHQPFRIATAHASVQVLGTSFLVNTRSTADEIVVVTGKVLVTDQSNEVNQVQLVAGERAVLQDDHFQQYIVTDSNFIAWQTGVLDFKQTPLQQVMTDLTHYYGLPVTIEQGQEVLAGTLHVTARFQSQSLEQALDEICLTTGLHIKKEAGKIILYQK